MIFDLQREFREPCGLLWRQRAFTTANPYLALVGVFLQVGQGVEDIYEECRVWSGFECAERAVRTANDDCRAVRLASEPHNVRYLPEDRPIRHQDNVPWLGHVRHRGTAKAPVDGVAGLVKVRSDIAATDRK